MGIAAGLATAQVVCGRPFGEIGGRDYKYPVRLMPGAGRVYAADLLAFCLLTLPAHRSRFQNFVRNPAFVVPCACSTYVTSPFSGANGVMTTEPVDLAGLPDLSGTISCGVEPSDRELLSRFSAHEDADAFEQLVRRHGPMVLSVCRRMLRDSHAADDAFQATFLVLVRKASSIRRPGLLGNWLYGVAYRIAFRARLQSAQRVDHEMRTSTMPDVDHTHEVERRELQEVLDEELSGLPKAYRDPLVLCYVQGKSHVEAARLLGCPVGSISGRLATARKAENSVDAARPVHLGRNVWCPAAGQYRTKRGFLAAGSRHRESSDLGRFARCCGNCRLLASCRVGGVRGPRHSQRCRKSGGRPGSDVGHHLPDGPVGLAGRGE